MLKGLGAPMPPSPRSIRAAALGLSTDDRTDVFLQLLRGGNESLGGGAAATSVAAVSPGGGKKTEGFRGGEEGQGPADNLSPWAAGSYYPASTPGRRVLSPTNHSAAERRRRDRINDRFDILRRLIPGTQKADKATVLKTVIDYVSRLQAAGADNLLQKEGTDEQAAPQQQAAMSEVYTPSARSWGSEEEEATTSPQDKVSVDVRDQAYVVRITCPTRPRLLFDIVSTLKQLGLEVTDGELSSCRGRVLHVLYVPTRNVTKDVIRAKLEAAVFPGRPLNILRPSGKQELGTTGLRFEGPVEPPVQLQLPPRNQRKETTSKKRKSTSGGQ